MNMVFIDKSTWHNEIVEQFKENLIPLATVSESDNSFKILNSIGSIEFQQYYHLSIYSVAYFDKNIALFNNKDAARCYFQEFSKYIQDIIDVYTVRTLI